MNIVDAFKSNFKDHLDKPTNKSPVSKLRRRNKQLDKLRRQIHGGK
jgi:hypothetical protein